jgi:hypothetical protein
MGTLALCVHKWELLREIGEVELTLRDHKRPTFMRVLITLLLLATGTFAADSRVALTFDTSEADAVLHILELRAAQRPVTDVDWQKLFATEPYKRLKQREAAMKRDFTDADFQKSVLSDELLTRRSTLSQTLQAWKKVDLNSSAHRVLGYLPPNATIHAKVFPVIKPKTNSFVWEAKTDPAIFLYLDPKESAVKFENTVAHELHHIGFASIESESEKNLAGLSPEAKATVQWMGGFGEGLAMLAAAGSPDVHPHANSSPEDRARWDRDMANFNSDLKTVEKFFSDILDGRLKTEDQQNEVGFKFFGEQGPWYTVGYKMGWLVEKRFGRKQLIECMLDHRKLLASYNQAAAEISSQRLELWSPELLKRVGLPGI